MSAVGAYLAKKSWNPGNRKNVEDVWKKEKEKKEEEARIAELRREKEEEREREALDEMQVKAGLKKHSGKLAWMYEGPAGSRPEDAAEIDAREREAFLMGDKAVTELKSLPPVRDSLDQAATAPAASAKASEGLALSAHEQFVRLHEDPLFAIRKKQMEQNPRAAALLGRARSPSSSSSSSRKKSKKKEKRERKEKKRAKKARKEARRKEREDKPAVPTAPKPTKVPGYGLQLPASRRDGASRSDVPSSLSQAPASSSAPPVSFLPRNEVKAAPPPTLSREERLQAMTEAARARDDERAHIEASKRHVEPEKATNLEDGAMERFMQRASAALFEKQPAPKRNRQSLDNDER